MLIKCNELVVNDPVVIPLVTRPTTVAMSNSLVAEISGWDNNTFDLANWFREG